MSDSYTVIVYSSAGTRLSYSDDVLSLGCTRAVNGIDIFNLTYLTTANSVAVS